MEEKKTLWDYFDKNIPIIAELEGEFNKNHKRLKKLIEAKSEPKKIIGVITQQKELIGRYFQQFKFLKEICKKLGYDSFIINKLNLVSLSRLVEIAELIQANARKGNLDELYGYYKAEEDAINRFNAENTEFRGIKTDFKPGFFSGVRRWAGVMIAVIAVATSAYFQGCAASAPKIKQNVISVVEGKFKDLPSSIKKSYSIGFIESNLKKSNSYRGIYEWGIQDKNNREHIVEFIQGWYHNELFLYKIDGETHTAKIPKSRLISIRDTNARSGAWNLHILRETENEIIGWDITSSGWLYLREIKGEFYLVDTDIGPSEPIEKWWK